MQQGGVASQVVGGFVVIALTLLTVGAIFQLNKPNSPIVPAAQSVTNTALGDVFK